MELKFHYCAECGNLVIMLKNSGIPVMCCGERMVELAVELTKSANEAKSSFLANMYHDIRTPMNAIVGLSNLLTHDAENPAKVKNHEFEIRAQGVDCDRVLGDKTRINQILLNLLSNSVKYTPEGGRIQLILSQRGRSDGRYAGLCFQVVDNGMDAHISKPIDMNLLKETVANLLCRE